MKITNIVISFSLEFNIVISVIHYSQNIPLVTSSDLRILSLHKRGSMDVRITPKTKPSNK